MRIELEQGVPLARLTTIGTGGPAQWLARPRSVAELGEALAFAASQGLAVEVIGLGSNVLAHDDGVAAVVVKLVGELAEVRIEGELLVAGGGAANAVCVHRARDAGLSGFEEAAAIPGTVGGGVRMNAGAYGWEFRDVLVDAVLVDAGGSRVVSVDSLGLGYRRSGVRAGEVVAGARLRLRASSPAVVRARVGELLAQRKATQPTNKRTFGSVFKNPDGSPGAGRMVEECGLKGHRVGGAIVSPRHANFIENAGAATSADCLALMSEMRRRVHERFGYELEHEVRFLGPLEL